MRAAQCPVLGEPSQMSEFPGDRVDACLAGRQPLGVSQIFNTGPGARARVTQGAGEVGIGKLASVQCSVRVLGLDEVCHSCF